MEKKIEMLWNTELMGDLINVEVTPLIKKSNNIVRDMSAMLIANIAAAFSTRSFLGKATEKNLKSIKSRIDISAAYVFDEMIKENLSQCHIASSEGKDEKGTVVVDPLKDLDTIGTDGLGIAVDVIDGTTLAAKGITGAYTLSAASYGLSQFPDLQAYGIFGPKKVIESFDFENAESHEIEKIIKDLSEYLNKPIEEIKVVTHSYDTGTHHDDLINTMRNMGVKVFIPEPVIVEPTYVIGLGMKIGLNPPDLIVGVFGLPEVLINSIILASVSNSDGVRFRIASNTMLQTPNQTDLHDRFCFSAEEKNSISKMGLNYQNVFCEDDIAQISRGCCFAISCITGDDILGMRSINTENNVVALDSIYGDMAGNVYKITTYHKAFNQVDYTARYNIPIDDLSIVSFLDDKDTISDIIEEIFTVEMNGCYVGSLKDFHVTLFEMGIHYGGYDNNSVSNLCEKIHSNICKFAVPSVRINSIVRKPYGIVAEVETNWEFDELGVEKIVENSSFCNVMKKPFASHITLGYFIGYLPYSELIEIDRRIECATQKNKGRTLIMKEPELIHIFRTPFEYEKG